MQAGARWQLQPGETFAGYRIERQLGHGGMGVIYAAVEPRLERKVALKLIAPDAAADETFRQRFAHESQIAASLEHPHVVPIYAAGEEDGVPWIAMRFISGSDLGKRVAAEGRLSPGDAVRLVCQVASGLDALHAAGLIHRDVKPANVLLSGPQGAEHVYLTDFGVARNVASESGLTKTGRFVGTIDYVAPEQIKGGQVDARIDVYALACMLFKLLTGEVPFPRDSEAARLYAHLNDPPPSAAAAAPEVPASLDAVIARGMAKGPDERYPSAGDLGRAALAALEGDAVSRPERTVAVGAAAGEAIGESQLATELLGAPDGSPPGTALQPGRAPAGTSRRPLGMPRRISELPRSGVGILLAFITAILVISIVVALAGGGGSDSKSADELAAEIAEEDSGSGGGSEGFGGDDSGSMDVSDEALSRSELISEADAACFDAQSEFRAARAEFPLERTDLSQALPFAARLVEISGAQVERMEALVPPAEIAALWENYMDLRRDVHTYDQNALEAAVAGDLEGYVFWRETNDAEAPERATLAREIGLLICSP